MVMIKAFLSHSSAQKTFVEKVAQILGLPVGGINLSS